MAESGPFMKFEVFQETTTLSWWYNDVPALHTRSTPEFPCCVLAAVPARCVHDSAVLVKANPHLNCSASQLIEHTPRAVAYSLQHRIDRGPSVSVVVQGSDSLVAVLWRILDREPVPQPTLAVGLVVGPR